MTPVEQEFQKFDWAASHAWKDYLDALYPVPPASKINKYKRKFYKAKVNPELSLDEPATPTTSESAGYQQPSTRTQPARPPTSSVPMAKKIWGPMAEVMLGCAVLSTIGAILPWSLQFRLTKAARILFGLGFIAAFISENGLPRKQLEYWNMLIFNYNIQSLLVLVSGIALRNALTLYSPAISAVSYIARRRSFQHPVLTRLVLNRPYLELLVGFIGIGTWLIRRSSLMGVLMYWNSLRILYSINASTKRAFQNLNVGIVQVLAHPRVPPAVRNGYNVFSCWLHSKCDPAQ